MPDLSGLGSSIGGFLNPKPSNDEVTIKINGGKILGFASNTIQRSINTIADGFNFSISYDPDEPYAEYFDPFTYHDCDVLINDKEFIKGQAIKWQPSFTNSGSMMLITVRSKTGVLADCPPKSGKLSYKNRTLKEIAEEICGEFGLTVDFPDGDSDIIKKINRDAKQTAASFLQKIAKNTGFIINTSRIKTSPGGVLDVILPEALQTEEPDSSATDADLVFEKANINGKPILKLKQGEQPLLSVNASYDGEKRYSDFQVNSQTKGNPNNTTTIKDETVPIYRPNVSSASNIEQGGLQGSAEWRKARTLSDSAPVSVSIDGWRDNDDNTVLENEIVTLLAPNACVFQETRFLIEKINLIQGVNGKQADLTLVLPQAYTKEFPTADKMPWVRPALSLFDAFLKTIETLGGIL